MCNQYNNFSQFVGRVSNPPNFNLSHRLLPGEQKRMPEQQNAARYALRHYSNNEK